MHVIENRNTKAGKVYCYIGECRWDKVLRKRVNSRISVGYIKGEPPIFTPNKFIASLLESEGINESTVSTNERMIIDTLEAKYGNIRGKGQMDVSATAKPQTAWAVFTGPAIVFGGITSRYMIDAMLEEAFGNDDAQLILSLAWFLASEGDALSNSDVWLNYYETPSGRAISSQEVTRLLDRMNQDGIMTFYKNWLKSIGRTGDKVLYDLTSISWYGRGINMAGWGYNRDKENLPQVNYALLCARNTGMPLFAWPLDGSISDVSTLQNTLQLLKKLDYKPDCIMMDRAFGSEDNITYMLKHRYTFLQALRVNATWIRGIIDSGKEARLRPDSMIKADERVYYASTTACRWVMIEKTNRKGEIVKDIVVYQCKESKREKYQAEDGEVVVNQYLCFVHVLFCQDLVGDQWDRFMEKLNIEYARLSADEDASPPKDLKDYFIIERKKWSRKRSVEFNMENIGKHRNNYVGYVCFITNDKSILAAKDALSEYSTRDYIEKDFDEMKNEIDMNRIRVHTDSRMKARLFIQFIAEIYMREIRVKLRNSDDCRKMTKKQIFSHIKGIYKIKFVKKHSDVCPELSKSQRSILQALGLRDSRKGMYV